MKMFGQSALARVGALSVKLKILSLSLLTAIGMLSIGGVFWWSQNEVAGAFNKLDQSAGLARSVADLSDIANGMRNIGKGYLARPEERTTNFSRPSSVRRMGFWMTSPPSLLPQPSMRRSQTFATRLTGRRVPFRRSIPFSGKSASIPKQAFEQRSAKTPTRC